MADDANHFHNFEPSDDTTRYGILDFRFSWEGQSTIGLLETKEPFQPPVFLEYDDSLSAEKVKIKTKDRSGNVVSPLLNSQGRDTDHNGRASEWDLTGSQSFFLHQDRANNQGLIANIPSLMTQSQYELFSSIPPVLSEIITKPAICPDLPTGTAWVYVSKANFIGILTALEYILPIGWKIDVSFLPKKKEAVWKETFTIPEFLAVFNDSRHRTPLTDDIRYISWEIRCKFPRGVIYLHSLAGTTYQHVFLFRFLPLVVTGIETSPDELTPLRDWLNENPNISTLFPKVTPRIMTDSSKLKNRPLSELVNKLPKPFPKKITNDIKEGDFGFPLERVKSEMHSNVFRWSNPRMPTMAPPRPHPTKLDPEHRIFDYRITDVPDQSVDPFPPMRNPNKEETGLGRAYSNRYMKHPLQNLKQPTVSSLALSSVSDSYASLISPSFLQQQMERTPMIIQTNPESEVSIIHFAGPMKMISPTKLIPRIVRSIKHTFRSTPLPCAVVYWSEIVETVACGTIIPPCAESGIILDVYPNIRTHLAEEFGALTSAITKMYIEEAYAAQFDLIRVKLPPQPVRDDENIPFLRLGKRGPFVDMIDKGAGGRYEDGTFKGKSKMNESSAASVEISTEKVGAQDDVPENKGSLRVGGGRRKRKAIGNGEDILRPKPEEQISLHFDHSELNLTTRMLVPQSYMLDGVIAGYLVDTAEWIKKHKTHWKDAMLERREWERGPEIIDSPIFPRNS